jgi:HAD superfamily hydrolase (TIGR01509 family)
MSNHKTINSFAVIFDMDGVIVDSNPYHKEALKEFCDSRGYHLSEAEMREKIFGRTNKDWLTRLFGKEISPGELRQFEEEKESLFRQLIEPHIKPVDGLLSFLESLEENQIPRAVATSAPPANVSFTLEKTGTARFFSFVINGNDVSHSKPHPEIYLKTAAAIDFSPHCCLVIEDSLSGVAAAREAGCQVIGITTTHSKDELRHTQKVIDNFYEIRVEELEQFFK